MTSMSSSRVVPAPTASMPAPTGIPVVPGLPPLTISLRSAYGVVS